MNLSFHRMATVVTVALALLLGGCGSSDTKTAMEETAMEETAMEETAMDEGDEMPMDETANAKSLAVAQAIVGGKHKATSDAVPGPEFNLIGATDIKRKTGDADISLNQSTFAAGRKPFIETDADIDSTWAGKEFHYAASNGKTKEMGAVFTDIEAYRDVFYIDFFTADDPTSVPAEGTGAIMLNGPIDAENLAPGLVPVATTDADTSSRPFPTVGEVSGLYYGVPGKYTCLTTCTLTRDSDGKVTVEGSLTFAPTLPTGVAKKAEALMELMVRDAVTDTDFLHFGYWMESRTKQANGTYKHRIETFSDGSMPFSVIGNVKGTAEYLGTAAGIYVNKSDFDSDGKNPQMVRHGTFTADAELKAHFGDDDGVIAVADQFSISGSVTNFSDNSGTDLGWTLVLKKADLGIGRTSNGVIEGATGEFNGETGGGNQDGEWSGAMYGPSESPQPTGVAGEFNGHFPNGHVAGAFSATQD